jgi:hypothetical protein
MPVPTYRLTLLRQQTGHVWETNMLLYTPTAIHHFTLLALLGLQAMLHLV